MDPPPIVVIAGATATGKTGLSILLAAHLRAGGSEAEVISADSRQVYRGLDIGTAKVTPAERAGIPHHGLDLVDPDAAFSVVDYVAHVRSALGGLGARGGIALLVGGTGLYLRAVARGLDTAALPFDPVARAEAEALIADRGLVDAVARLRRLAPSAAERVDLRNPRRVARALEIATVRGDGPPPRPLGYPGRILWLGLRVERDEHHRRIRERAAAQFASGLLDEARALRERWNPSLPCFSAIGYREAWAVLDGDLALDAAIELDARRNVAFARRQATWFRAEPGIEWLDATTDPAAAAIDAVETFLGQR